MGFFERQYNKIKEFIKKYDVSLNLGLLSINKDYQFDPVKLRGRLKLWKITRTYTKELEDDTFDKEFENKMDKKSTPDQEFIILEGWLDTRIKKILNKFAQDIYVVGEECIEDLYSLIESDPDVSGLFSDFGAVEKILIELYDMKQRFSKYLESEGIDDSEVKYFLKTVYISVKVILSYANMV